MAMRKGADGRLKILSNLDLDKLPNHGILSINSLVYRFASYPFLNPSAISEGIMEQVLTVAQEREILNSPVTHRLVLEVVELAASRDPVDATYDLETALQIVHSRLARLTATNLGIPVHKG